MSVTPLPPAATIADSPTLYAEKAEALNVALVQMVNEFNAINDNTLIVQERKAVGVAGGNSSSAAANLRQLNYTVVNKITGAVVDGSPGFTIQLPAGTYEVEAWAVAYSSGAHRIYATAPTTIYGSSALSSSGNQTESRLTGRFTTAGGNFTLWHLVQTSQPANGLGYPTSLGATDEIYAQVKITRV